MMLQALPSRHGRPKEVVVSAVPPQQAAPSAVPPSGPLHYCCSSIARSVPAELRTVETPSLPYVVPNGLLPSSEDAEPAAVRARRPTPWAERLGDAAGLPDAMYHRTGRLGADCGHLHSPMDEGSDAAVHRQLKSPEAGMERFAGNSDDAAAAAEVLGVEEDDDMRAQWMTALFATIANCRALVAEVPSTERSAEDLDITPEQREKVLQACSQLEDWLQNKARQQETLARGQSPVLLCAEMEQRNLELATMVGQEIMPE